MNDNLTIALSPIQLFAVLSEKTITESEILGNRLWSSLNFIFGVAEIVGATALCLVPNTTFLTKVCCATLGAHGIDILKTAIDKVFTGIDRRSITATLVEKTAVTLGASKNTAWRIGLAVDVAVPVVLTSVMRLMRVSSVKDGCLRLIEHEAVAGSKLGGHTLARHVGLSEAELRARMVKSPVKNGISTFTDIRTAEKVISEAMHANRAQIREWAKFAKKRAIFQFNYNSERNLGFGIATTTGPVIKLKSVRIVLVMEK